jgi:hypothetical protein
MRERCASKSGLLAGVYFHRRSLASRVAFTFPYRDRCGITIRIHVDTVIARLLHRKRQVRRVDLIHLAAIKLAHVDIQSALVQLHLHDVIIDVGQSEAALGVDPQQAGTHVQFRARILVSPDVVRIGQRTVRRPRYPVVNSTRLYRHRPAHKLKTRHPARRVIRKSRRRRQQYH